MKTVLLAVAIFFAAFTVSAQWVPQTSNITVNYFEPFIKAVDANVCWALVADPLNQLGPVAEFTRTADGGTTWVDGAISNAAGLCPSSITAINKDTAWVAMFNSVTNSQGRILRTNDGGATWTWQSTALFSAAGNFPDWIHFWDANNGVCLGDPTGGYFEIYTTSDGGTTWTRVPTGQIATQLAGEFGITDVFRAQGSSNIWFGTNFGRIYRSTDGGHNWAVSQTPFTDFIGAIAFRDAMNGIAQSGGATGSADVARTTDGGATWSLVGTTKAGITLAGGLCYLPGSDSTYFCTSDFAGSINGSTFSPNNGTSWVPVDNLLHTDVDFVNDSTGWTGSADLNAPMYKWSTPIVIAPNDVASQSIDVPTNAGMMTQNPKATVMNDGLSTQTFDVTMTITGGYTSTKTVTGLAFFNTSQVTFDPWTPAATGNYTIKVYTSLATDSNHPNDTITKDVVVFEAFENCGWVSKPNIGVGTFGLAGAFNLIGESSSSPGTLYSLGGADFAAVQATNNAFTTATSSWGALAPMTTPKYQFSAHCVNGKIICAGGYSAGFTPDANTYIYDIASDTWSTGAAMPVPVGDYASGVYNDTLIYYIGGYNGTADVNTVYFYNTVSDTWTAATSKPGTACAGLRGAISGRTIVLAGGYSQSLGAEIADAYTGIISPIDPTQITWIAISPYPAGPVGRLGAGAVFKNFKPLVIFAGGDPTGAGTATLGDCWAYDVGQTKWVIGAPKITPVSNISDLAGVIYNDTLWMASVAGYDGAAISTVNEWLCLGPFLWTGVKTTVSKTNSLNVYPNPASNELTVVMKDNNTNSVLTISDVAGRVVYSDVVGKGKTSVKINTSVYDAGLYFITVTSDEGAVTNAKFVKE